MNNYFKSFSLLFLSCIIYCAGLSQPAGKTTQQWNKEVLDSLLIVIKTNPPEDSNRVDVLYGIGFRYARLVEHEQALVYFKQSLTLAQKLDLKMRQYRAMLNIGSSFLELGNFKSAIDHYEESIKIAKELNNQKAMATSKSEIAAIHVMKGNYNEALVLYQSAREIYKETKSKDGYAFSCSSIGNCYHRIGNYQAALDTYLDILEYWKGGKEVFDSIWTSDISNRIGTVYADLGNFEVAEKYFNSALTIAQKIRKAVALKDSYSNIAMINNLKGNYPEALKNYLLALKEAEHIKNKRFIADIQNNIGNIYNAQDNYQEALNHYKIALKIREELENKAAIIRIYSNMGTVYGKQNLFTDALQHHEKARKLAEESSDKEGLSISNYNIGSTIFQSALKSQPTISIAKFNSQLEEALNFQKTSLQYATETRNKINIAQANIALGNIISTLASLPETHKPSEKYNESIKYLTLGLNPLKELGVKQGMREGYLALSKAYEGIKDYKNALLFASLYMQMKDSLFNKETNNKLQQLRLEFEIEKSATNEKTKQQKIQAEMQFAFNKREDSLRFQQALTNELLKSQTLLAQKQEQDLRLKQASLDLSNKENELNRLAYLKTQAELQSEQSQRREKEDQLTIADKERALQSSQLKLQQSELTYKESQLLAEKRQRSLLIIGIILLTLLFFVIFRNFQNRQKTNVLMAAEKMKNEKLAASHRMAELELQSLRTQLNPHFMFNSLNAIQELILMEDNENSHLYLSRFSELLRTLLDNANQPFISLKKEIDFLKLYISLENLRIPDLQYSIEIDKGISPAEVMIPNMMLQPYIENAIWHGLSHKKEDRKLNVRIREAAAGIQFEIEDNGVGRKKATELKNLYRQKHKSKGMELLSKRFNLLSKEYGAEIQTQVLDLEKENQGAGTFVKIIVPLSLTEKNELQKEHDQSYHN